jgi:hypothetical protein
MNLLTIFFSGELNEFDIHAFRTTLEVNSNYSIGNSDGGLAMGQSPVVSGAALGSNSGKRVRDELAGAGCSESSQVKKSKGVLKNKQFSTGVDKLVEESKERRDQLDNVTNKSKNIADMRALAEMFQHSTESIYRIFKDVLKAVLNLHAEYIRLPDSSAGVHNSVGPNSRNYLFKV